MVAIWVILAFIAGVLLGTKVYKTMLEVEEKKQQGAEIQHLNEQYGEVLENITMGLSKFKSRINSTVLIESKLEKHGNIEIVYFLDQKSVSIFSADKCLYISDKADKHVIQDISKAITHAYKNEIEQVFDFFGLVISKDEFERRFRFNPDDFSTLFQKNAPTETPETEKIIDKNGLKFDVDEILDKISISGIEALSPAEKLFLDNLGNEKRD